MALLGHLGLRYVIGDAVRIGPGAPFTALRRARPLNIGVSQRLVGRRQMLFRRIRPAGGFSQIGRCWNVVQVAADG